MPKDGCDECGSTEFEAALEDEAAQGQFMATQVDYNHRRDELLGFYNHLGLLVDCEPRRGYADYEKVKRELQFNIKH